MVELLLLPPWLLLRKLPVVLPRPHSLLLLKLVVKVPLPPMLLPRLSLLPEVEKTIFIKEYRQQNKKYFAKSRPKRNLNFH